MAKTSGGVRGGGNTEKGATEKGYSERMAKAITDTEKGIRFNRDESLFVFDENGNKIISFTGKGAEVKYDEKKIPENSIITHNHPRSIGLTGIRAIGNSFSVDDIYSAVNLNAREIRAVTPTYTFSVRRPKGGWGGTAKKVAEDFNKASEEVKTEMFKYLNATKWNDNAIARAETTHFHKVMNKMSKNYGWDYIKKRNKY